MIDVFYYSCILQDVITDPSHDRKERSVTDESCEKETSSPHYGGARAVVVCSVLPRLVVGICSPLDRCPHVP